MTLLSAAELLAAWERGTGQRPFEQAVILLKAALPELSPDQIVGLSIGVRDERLMDLRESVFGPTMTILAACPQCSERLESTIALSGLRTSRSPEAPPTGNMRVGPYAVRFRPVNSGDLIACAETGIDSRAMVRRCIEDASLDGTAIPASLVPDEVVGTIERTMAEMDPAADVSVNLTCPACAFSWSEPFDIVTFFWAEIDAWARRLLADVHVLASSYGWSERDILALSPIRRQYYLEMVNG